MEGLEFQLQNATSDKIIELLGISDARHAELQAIYQDAYKKTDGWAQGMAYISKEVATPAELSFCVFHYGALAQMVRSIKEDPMKLFKMLGDAIKAGQES